MKLPSEEEELAESLNLQESDILQLLLNAKDY